MFVKPAPHPDKPDEQRRVRIPHTHALLANAGEEVPDNAFWLRRRMHGDVVDAERPQPPAAATALQHEVASETTAVDAPPEPHSEAAAVPDSSALRAAAASVDAPPGPRPEAAAATPAPVHAEATAAAAPATGTGA